MEYSTRQKKSEFHFILMVRLTHSVTINNIAPTCLTLIRGLVEY